MHLDEEQIQRLLHGELSREAESAARAHVAMCAACKGTVDATAHAESEVTVLLSTLDHPAPSIGMSDIAARARKIDSARILRRAAGVLLAFGLAGAVYALPGSPVPGWVKSAIAWVAARPESPPASGSNELAAPPSQVSGIAVEPGDTFMIRFEHESPESRVHISLTDGDEVVVRGPAGAATFSSGVGQLVIDNSGPAARFEIEIPRAASSIEIRVGPDRIFSRDGRPGASDGPASRNADSTISISAARR